MLQELVKQGHIIGLVYVKDGVMWSVDGSQLKHATSIETAYIAIKEEVAKCEK